MDARRPSVPVQGQHDPRPLIEVPYQQAGIALKDCVESIDQANEICTNPELQQEGPFALLVQLSEAMQCLCRAWDAIVEDGEPQLFAMSTPPTVEDDSQLLKDTNYATPKAAKEGAA